MDENWYVRETEFRRAAVRQQESVFTIGNGYLSTRGAFEEGFLGDLPATWFMGSSTMPPSSRRSWRTHPTGSLIPIIGEERLQLDAGRLLHYERVLDLRTGVLTRAFRWQRRAGQTVDIVYERFISLADKNVMMVRCRITPVDFSGAVVVQAPSMGR